MNAFLRPLHNNDRQQDGWGSTVDLGHEAPIELDGLQHTAQDHRQVSFRWLAGTVLTGLSGAALIGAAIFAAFDRQATFADAPQASNPVHRDTGDDGQVSQAKGDRLVKSVDLVAAKQTFRTPTTIKVGDHEILKTRSFTRVSTDLALTTLGFADDVPKFNPVSLMSDARASGDPVPDTGPVTDDAEVSFVTRDFNAFDTDELSVNLSEGEAEAQVIEHIKNALSAGAKTPLPLPSQMLLMRTSRASLDPTGGLGATDTLPRSPFSSIQVRMTVENVTQLPKAVASPRNAIPSDRLVVVHKGEMIEDVLRNGGVNKDQIRAVSTAFGLRRGDLISEGKRIKLQFADFDGAGGDVRLARVSVYTNEKLDVQVGLADNGSFVRAAQQTIVAARPARQAAKTGDEADDENSDGMQLYTSLFETAMKQDIPRPMIDDLVRIFANDIDFLRPVAGGDSFEAFYSEPEEGETRGELLYASVTARNETFRYYRYQNRDDASVDYYDENGRSTRKFLIRTPINAARLSSPFGYRYHPILGYRKFHSGQDWAAPVGTPIVASGNGTIVSAGWDSGYGRRVEIQHSYGYLTTYNHMSGFARGTTEGARVKQGDVIGYVGQTGLATGPHLHYEVKINGEFADPMRIRLARTKEFDGSELAFYKRERDRIDGLLARAPNATSKVAAQR